MVILEVDNSPINAWCHEFNNGDYIPSGSDEGSKTEYGKMLQ